MLSNLLLAALSANLVASQNSGNTATANLAALRGKPQYLASGIIYGMPNEGFPGMTVNQIPDSYYTDIGFRYGRAGGAQMAEGGWVDGLQSYYARFNSTKQNYVKCRQFGARFQILPHDVWGTDHSNQSAYWPGDNGDWAPYDKFLKQLMGDLVKNKMLTGLDWDLWNEPEGSGFWARSQDQYLALWNRTFHTLRADSNFKSVPIVGPSSAGQPSLNNGWWTKWISYVVKNNVIPDQYTWHEEPGDPENDVPNLQAVLKAYNAPSKPININEYATFDQQNSAGAAWWISRLERWNILGLRGNWLSTCQLHDFMASLLGKSDTNSCGGSGYYPNGEYQVYKYYYKNMTGTRATTSTSGDRAIDIYTTVGTDAVRTLTGVLNNVGTWYVTINNLTSVGYPSTGTLNIHTYGFKWNDHYGGEGAPVDLGVYGHPINGGSVTFPIYQTQEDQYTAWTFEFPVVKKS